MAYQPPAQGFFDSFRSPPFPTLYGDLKTPVTSDVLYVGWCTAFLTVFISFIIIVPGSAKKFIQQFGTFLRVLISLGIGLVVMLCNFGQEWEVGSLDTHTAYKAGTGQEIYANVAVKLSLRSVNITLKALQEPEGALTGETINYNERFYWTWAQGRAGFGPFGGELQRGFRSAQFRGSPLPILWVAEYFTFDGEGIRFGRNYRTAGWFAHICVWLAFPLWILSIILFKLRIDYASHCLTLLGASLFIAALIWAFRRNFIELSIPFADGNLETKFGIHWYLALIVGVICLIGGILIYFLDRSYHNELSEIFGNNPLTIIDQEVVVDSEEPAEPSDNMEMGEVNAPRRPAKPVTLLRSRGTTKHYNKKVSYPVYQQYDYNQYYNQGHEVDGGYGYDQQGYDQSYHNYQEGYDHSTYQNQGYQQDQAQGGYGEGYATDGYNYDQQGTVTAESSYPQQEYPQHYQEETYEDVQAPDQSVPPPRPPKRY